jgi:predicted metal-binding membrane protein
LQWGLEQLDLSSPMMTTTSKVVCLRHCRSPLSFLAQKWPPSRLGAFRMGVS